MPILPTELAKDLNIAMKMELLYSLSNLIDIGTGAQIGFSDHQSNDVKLTKVYFSLFLIKC